MSRGYFSLACGTLKWIYKSFANQPESTLQIVVLIEGEIECRVSIVIPTFSLSRPLSEKLINSLFFLVKVGITF